MLVDFGFNVLNVVSRAMKIETAVLSCVLKFVLCAWRNKV